jgi:hypothetical protein
LCFDISVRTDNQRSVGRQYEQAHDPVIQLKALDRAKMNSSRYAGCRESVDAIEIDSFCTRVVLAKMGD